MDTVKEKISSDRRASQDFLDEKRFRDLFRGRGRKEA